MVIIWSVCWNLDGWMDGGSRAKTPQSVKPLEAAAAEARVNFGSRLRY